MRNLLLLLPVLLGGCAAMFPQAATYIPVTAEVTDAKQYGDDLTACHLVADGYKPGLNIGAITQATITGATSNAADAVIPPVGLVPAAGAAGGAATAILGGLGVNGTNSIKVLVKCIEEKTRRDKSAIVADPAG